ncbi:MAG: glycine oxidase ThiO [Candidatus Acidiferrales bacterium]
MKTFDAIIVGGGIIGGSLAFELANCKLSVLIVDRQTPGQEASWAAAGMLAPEPESADDIHALPLAKMSLARYPQFVNAIEEASGLPAQFRSDGTLRLYFGPNAERERDREAANHRHAGLSTESVSMAQAREIEPNIASSATAAAWLPYECSVDPRALTHAVLTAAKHSGVEIVSETAVNHVLASDGRCNGVVAGTETFHSRHVIIAAGCFSAGVDGMSRYAPTSPVRGQIVALQPSQNAPKRVLRGHNGYVVPRNDGRVIAGSTSENVGFEKQVTAEGIEQILRAAIELAPSLASALIVDTWSGLRPDTPDHLPILGPTDIHGLWIATGHYRNGILLAPGTARVMREWIVDGTPSLALERFSPLRFTAAQRIAAR